MNHGLLIGLAAGLASALLFAAVVRGGIGALPLQLLSPLPIVIAGLGWGTAASMAAAVVGVGVIAAALSIPSGIGFGLVWAMPPVVLAYLIGLARPLDPADPTGPRQWYPLGRIVLAAALFSTLSIGVVLALTFDPAEALPMLADMLQAFQQERGTPAALSRPEIEALARSFATILPVVLGATAALVYLVVLWLGARIVRASGRLTRPWEDLAAFELPRGTGLALAGALLAVALPPPFLFIAGPLAGALVIVFVVLGFAVLHTVLRGSPSKPIWLTLAYAGAFLFSVVVVPALVLLGLAERLLRLRQRRPRSSI